MARKVKPGDPLRIAASDWNTLLSVAEQHRGDRSGVVPGARLGLSSTGVIVPVKNSTGTDVNRFCAAALDGPLFTHGDNADTFLNQLVMDGVAMTASYFGKWCVFQEAVADGKIGRAMLQGVTVAKITVEHADHDRVDVDTASGSQLISAFYGAGEILYKESGTGTKWSIVRIGSFVSPMMAAKASGSITAGSSGTAVIQIDGADSESVTAYLDWMAGAVDAEDDDELMIRFFKDRNVWLIFGAQCPEE